MMRLFGRKAAREGVRPALSRMWGSGVALGEWPRSYEAQVREAYLGNAIAQRAVRIVAEGVASLGLTGEAEAVRLIGAESAGQGLMETLAAHLLLHGNGYAWNVIELYDQVDSGLGGWKYKIGSEAISATISSAGTAALRRTVATSANPAQAQACAVTRASGAIRFQGWVPYDSAVPGIDFVNMGYPGSQYASWTNAANGWGPFYGIDALGGDLVINQMGVGEYISSTQVPAQAIYDGLMTLGTRDRLMNRDLLIVVPSPPNEAAFPGRAWRPYVQAHYDAARDLDAPLIDTDALFGAWSAGNVYDEVHYLEPANVRIAAAVDRVLAMVG